MVLYVPPREPEPVTPPEKLITERVAGQDLGGHRAVYVDQMGLFRYASADSDTARQVAGITTGAALEGAAAFAQAAGPLNDPSFSWAVGSPVFLGLNGQLTQSPPPGARWLPLAVVHSPTLLHVRIGAMPILRG